MIDKNKTAKLIENEKPERLMPFSTDSGFYYRLNPLAAIPLAKEPDNIEFIFSYFHNYITFINKNKTARRLF